MTWRNVEGVSTLILLCGEHGAGKSTLMYSRLNDFAPIPDSCLRPAPGVDAASSSNSLSASSSMTSHVRRVRRSLAILSGIHADDDEAAVIPAVVSESNDVVDEGSAGEGEASSTAARSAAMGAPLTSPGSMLTSYCERVRICTDSGAAVLPAADEEFYHLALAPTPDPRSTDRTECNALRAWRRFIMSNACGLVLVFSVVNQASWRYLTETVLPEIREGELPVLMFIGMHTDELDPHLDDAHDADLWHIAKEIQETADRTVLRVEYSDPAVERLNATTLIYASAKDPSKLKEAFKVIEMRTRAVMHGRFRPRNAECLRDLEQRIAAAGDRRSDIGEFLLTPRKTHRCTVL